MNTIDFSPSHATRVAIFASYNKDNRVADYVVYMLGELRKVVDAIVFVADNDLDKKQIQRIAPYIDHAICHRHGSYDFGSYRIGYQWALTHGLLTDADELLMINDSCYGPVVPFEPIFSAMAGRTCDFWGLVDSNEGSHHIQSFFMAFRRQVFLSPIFSNFVNDFRKQEGGFWDYVDLYERRFTDVLESQGFVSDVYVKPDCEMVLAASLYSGNGNMTLWPLTMLRLGMPLVKVKAMTGAFGEDMQESPEAFLHELQTINPELAGIIQLDRIDRGFKREDRWCTAEQIVGSEQVVSFDIFDTLLQRPFLRPTDLFALMEKDLKLKGFAKRRIKAEREARRRHQHQADVTIDQIYTMMGTRYVGMKEVEMDYERRLLTPKTDGLRIYKEALRQGTTIIAVSDMYLPSAFLLSVLREKGYTAISEVFVSCEENACKDGGALFRKVMQKMGIKAGQMVHIGDNHQADIVSAENEGVRSVERRKDTDQLLLMPSMMRYEKLKKTPSLALSVNIALQAQHKASCGNVPDPFSQLGYELGGPLAVGYVEHIHRVAHEQGIDGLLFVSRDGYALYEVYKKLYPNDIKAYYIEASRTLIMRNRAHYEDGSYQQRVWQLYAEEQLDGQMVDESNCKTYEQDMEAWADDNAARYKAYVDSLNIEGERLMTVDMTTMAYTSLRLLTEVFGHRIYCGMFSTTHGDSSSYKVMSYDEHHWDDSDMDLVILEEELITAPLLSADSIGDDGSFVRDASNPTEVVRVDRYARILQGIMEYALDYHRLLDGHETRMTFDEWKQLAGNYLKYPNHGTIQLFNQVDHEDSLHQVYHSLTEEMGLETSGGSSNKGTPIHQMNVMRLRRKQHKHLRTIRLLIAVAATELILLALNWIL